MRPTRDLLQTRWTISGLLSVLAIALFVPTLCAQTFEPTPSLTIPSYEIAPASEIAPSYEVFPSSEFAPFSEITTRSAAMGTLANDFSLTVRTDVLARFVEQQRVESDNVATQVMEADVRGVQTTTTSVHLQSVHCDGMARLHILTNGTVSSNTVGLTPQARVATLGNHTFCVTKPVFFDGDRLRTKPAYGTLQARQIPQAVNSVASGVPLLGPIGDRIARNEFYRRKPISDAIVVRQVADDVLPRVNSETDCQLAELNNRWRDFRQTLTRLSGGQQSGWTARTTDNTLTLSARSPSTTSLAAVAGPSLTSDLQQPEAVAMTLSQDTINRWLEAQPLSGLTIPDTALQQAVQIFQQARENPQALLQLLRPSAEEPSVVSLRLAESEPVSVAFEAGQLVLQIRLQIVPKAAPASQLHQIRVELGGQTGADGKWMITLNRIAVEPADRDAEPDAWTKLIDAQASQMVTHVPPSELPRTLDLSHIDQRIPSVRIHRIQCEGGQLRISFRLDASAQQVTTRRFVR